MDLKILTTFVALMRNLLSVLYALLFGAALTVSCGQAGRSLNEVERTVNDYPDSALIALRAIRPHTPRLKAQHALLTSRALDKAYIDIEEDSIARIAVDWYRHRRPLSKRMMAWYYLGRVQMNGGNYSSAIISLMEAESLAERIHDNHYLGLIEQNISEIYNLSYDPKHALEASDRSIDAFTRAQEPEYINWSVLNKANILIGLRQYGDADSLLSLLLQKESQYGRFRQEVQKHLILLNLYQDNASPEQTLEMIRDLQ